MRKLLVKLAGLLNRHKIKFLLLGGIASVKYGAPRATFDIDIVLRKDTIPKNFLEILQSEKIRSVEGFTFNEFIRSQYSVFKDDQGNEIDIWLKVDGFEFDDDAWKHRSDENINKIVVHFMSPEDMVVSKLSITQTEINNIDVLSILTNQTDNFDFDYFSRRIKQFAIIDKIRDLKEEINKLIEDEEIRPHLKNVLIMLKKIENENPRQ